MGANLIGPALQLAGTAANTYGQSQGLKAQSKAASKTRQESDLIGGILQMIQANDAGVDLDDYFGQGHANDYRMANEDVLEAMAMMLDGGMAKDAEGRSLQKQNMGGIKSRSRKDASDLADLLGLNLGQSDVASNEAQERLNLNSIAEFARRFGENNARHRMAKAGRKGGALRVAGNLGNAVGQSMTHNSLWSKAKQPVPGAGAGATTGVKVGSVGGGPAGAGAGATAGITQLLEDEGYF